MAVYTPDTNSRGVYTCRDGKLLDKRIPCYCTRFDVSDRRWGAKWELSRGDWIQLIFSRRNSHGIVVSGNVLSSAFRYCYCKDERVLIINVPGFILKICFLIDRNLGNSQIKFYY